MTSMTSVAFGWFLFLLLLRERDATKESTTRTVLLEKKHPDVKVATVVDAHCSTLAACRATSVRSIFLSFFVSLLEGEFTKGRERRERLKN